MAIAGFYSNGLTADRHEVELRAMGETLHVCTPDRSIDFRWHGGSIRLLEEVYDDQPVRLTHGDHPDAVLTVPPQPGMESILKLNDRFRRRFYAGTITWQRLVTGTLFVGVAVVGLLLSTEGLARLLADNVPEAMAEQLGESVLDTVLGDAPVCTTGDGHRVLTHLASKLAEVNAYDGPLQVTVVDEGAVNAVAAPGGRIVIFSGLIDEATSGDEVAGVLAHELGHVMERHAIQGLAQRLTFRFILGAVLGDATVISGTLADVGTAAAVLSYSREMETRADELAVTTLNRAGISGAGLATFFKRHLEESADTESPRWLSSHPLHQERVTAIEAADLGGGAAMDEPDWLALKHICGKT